MGRGTDVGDALRPLFRNSYPDDEDRQRLDFLMRELDAIGRHEVKIGFLASIIKFHAIFSAMPQALLLILLLGLPVFAQVSGKVVAISDGETLTIFNNRTQTKVGLAGIDAPEKGQDYSDVAKGYLSSLVYGRTSGF